MLLCFLFDLLHGLGFLWRVVIFFFKELDSVISDFLHGLDAMFPSASLYVPVPDSLDLNTPDFSISKSEPQFPYPHSKLVLVLFLLTAGLRYGPCSTGLRPVRVLSRYNTLKLVHPYLHFASPQARETSFPSLSLIRRCSCFCMEYQHRGLGSLHSWCCSQSWNTAHACQPFHSLLASKRWIPFDLVIVQVRSPFENALQHPVSFLPRPNSSKSKIQTKFTGLWFTRKSKARPDPKPKNQTQKPTSQPVLLFLLCRRLGKRDGVLDTPLIRGLHQR